MKSPPAVFAMVFGGLAIVAVVLLAIAWALRSDPAAKPLTPANARQPYTVHYTHGIDRSHPAADGFTRPGLKEVWAVYPGATDAQLRNAAGEIYATLAADFLAHPPREGDPQNITVALCEDARLIELNGRLSSRLTVQAYKTPQRSTPLPAFGDAVFEWKRFGSPRPTDQALNVAVDLERRYSLTAKDSPRPSRTELLPQTAAKFSLAVDECDRAYNQAWDWINSLRVEPAK